MPVFKVRVKWGKQKFEAVELNTDEPPTLLKTQLFSLSGVPPERQKVMVAGVAIGDESWGRAGDKIKENVMLLMMGSAEQLPQAPDEQPRFIEDMSESEAVAALALPVGLENFGNTCYMNATIQCLRAVPELKDALKGHQSAQSGLAASVPGSPQALAQRLKILYEMMERDQAKLPLMLFLQSLHDAMPQFAERDEKTGAYQQQDAHECWSGLVSNLGQVLKMAADPLMGASSQQRFMEQYFGLELETVYKCVESSDEVEVVEKEKNYQLSCFIQQEVKYMHTGIKKGLEGTVEKNSPSLGRDAQYSKASRISRLPGYLIIQFVRFFVGKAGDSEEMLSKKILKDVKYPAKLDVYDFCSTALQGKLLPMRSKFKQLDEKKAAIKAQQISEGKFLGPKQPQREEEVDYEPFDFPEEPGSNSSGYYDLKAVLTHKGRSSSSGHYVAWVRHKPGYWLKLDDDKVSLVTEEEVLKLSGGGDWHTAYILVYGPTRLEKLKEDTQ